MVLQIYELTVCILIVFIQAAKKKKNNYKKIYTYLLSSRSFSKMVWSCVK